MNISLGYTVVLCSLFISTLVYSQVGIGTVTPNASAALEINSSNSGLLIPQVSLLNVTNNTAPVSSPATGLLVYNTNASVVGGNGTGYYYWSGGQWEKLITAASVSGWGTTGNSGTNPTSDFIGTSDAVDFVLRTNNTEKMRITSGGNVGIGENNPMNKLQVQGSFLLEGDFINQQTLGAHSGTFQSVPFTNLNFNPLTGTTVSIMVTDGNGVNNSAVFISGFARVFGGNLTGNNSSYGGYFLVLERADNPSFTGAAILTYTAGICYLETPNGATSSALAFGGGGHISYLDTGLTAGNIYYYRLTLVPNSSGITGGTFDVYQRDLNVLQIKQ